MVKQFFIDTLGSFIKYFWTKLIVTVPVGIFVVNTNQFKIIYALLLILILDTILGIWVSIRYQVFTSHRLSRITAKISRYTIGLASIWILSCASPDLFGWAFNFFGIFFILTEVFSNFEKLSLLGLKLPTQLLAKLNKNFYTFYFGKNDEQKEAVSKILSKNSDKYAVHPNDINLKENIFDN